MAVVLVVLFHLGIRPLTGGFVGVDVFFVLSGYLITGILLAEGRQGRFSFRQFYERRIRRILPALVLMLAVIVPLCCIVLLPDELSKFGENLAQTVTFCLNIFLWRDTGYFEREALQRPLLHLWSLAVEEQFYLVWPPVVALSMRLGQRQLATAAVIALLSLFFSQWLVEVGPGAAFYLPFGRAWEPMVGAMLACWSPSTVPSRMVREVLGALGLGMIVAAALIFSTQVPFPGFTALLPCVGALLVLYSGAGTPTLVAKLLSARPLVGVGLISYSLYLWHWPLFSLTALTLGRSLRPFEQAAIILTSVLLSYLSWRFVEVPFRRRAGRVGSQRAAYTFAGSMIALFVAIGATLALSDGLAGRMSAKDLAAFRQAESAPPLQATCHIGPRDPMPPVDACRFGSPAAPGSYDGILWGDSHANVLQPAVEVLARRRGLTVRQMTMSGCNPAVDPNAAHAAPCAAFNDKVLALIMASPAMKLVVLSARWNAYPEDYDRARMGQRLAALAARIRTKNVQLLVIGSFPEMRFMPARCIARSELVTGVRCPTAVPLHGPLDPVPVDQTIVRAVGNPPGVVVFLPTDVLCHGSLCLAESDGVSLYRDDNHLSRAGALFLAPYIAARAD